MAARHYLSRMTPIQIMLLGRGFRQRRLARELGLSEAYMSQISTGERRFPLDKLQPMADILWLPVADVLYAILKTKEERNAEPAV